MSSDPLADLFEECKEANAFRLAFNPEPGDHYDWVCDLAEAEYVRLVEVFKRLDEKAAAVANYLGAGTGLLTFGWLAGVAASQVSPWVILAAAPSLLAAASALVCAIGSRRLTTRPTPPSVAGAVAYAEFFRERGRAAFLGQWELCIAATRIAIRRKGQGVDDALRFFLWAVLLLAIPLGVALARKFLGLT